MPEQKAFPAPVRINTIGIRFRHFIQRAQQVINQFEADGIALLRAIQSERCQLALKCELNCFICHSDCEPDDSAWIAPTKC